MVKRIYNFSSGPAVLPLPVLGEAREALLSLGDTGIGILEHSHRGKAFLNVYNETVALFREVGRIPDDYEILFLQGGASTQFFMIPMNLLAKDQTADYLVTGAWSEKAIGEAKRFGNTHVACTSKDRNFCYIPKTRTYSPKPAYVHFTSNNTIFGTEFFEEPAVPAGTPLICDASSDIFSRPLDIKRYAVIYAGAQKNLGPAGTTLVIIRKDLIERAPKDLPTMLQYRTHASNESMYNTCPTFGIYVMGLVVKWIKSQGGVAALETRNRAKAEKLYAYLDSGRLFKATADRDSRSRMNVTFVTGKEELDNEFVKFAEKQGLDGLKGHRSVGGMRGSLYNAFPAEGVDALIDAMKRFESQHA
jgi:phosphoserine aminotransferase